MGSQTDHYRCVRGIISSRSAYRGRPGLAGPNTGSTDDRVGLIVLFSLNGCRRTHQECVAYGYAIHANLTPISSRAADIRADAKESPQAKQALGDGCRSDLRG